MTKGSQRYVLGRGRIADINHEAAAMWSDLRKPGSDLRKQAEKMGIRVDRLEGKYSKYVKIKKAESPVVPGGYEILIAVLGSSAAAIVAKQVWHELFMPWAKIKLGLAPAPKAAPPRKKAAARKKKK